MWNIPGHSFRDMFTVHFCSFSHDYHNRTTVAILSRKRNTLGDPSWTNKHSCTSRTCEREMHSFFFWLSKLVAFLSRPLILKYANTLMPFLGQLFPRWQSDFWKSKYWVQLNYLWRVTISRSYSRVQVCCWLAWAIMSLDNLVLLRCLQIHLMLFSVACGEVGIYWTVAPSIHIASIWQFGIQFKKYYWKTTKDGIHASSL